MRRVAQPTEKAAEARPAVGAAAPAGLPFLEAHDIGDSAVEESGGLRPALALVVEPGEQGGGVKRAQGQALGVMVEVGRAVAGEPPHQIGAAPADAQAFY